MLRSDDSVSMLISQLRDIAEGSPYLRAVAKQRTVMILRRVENLECSDL